MADDPSDPKASPEAGARRPLASRNTRLAHATARRLTAAGITPNAISAAGLAAGIAAGGALWAGGALTNPWLFALAGLLVQLRLLCNLLDGMVAVEGGRAAPDGAFWNEVPDRLADIAILVGAGLAGGALALGWAAAAMAVLTAYVRAFGMAEGLAADFGGPMAKPHRMAVVTAGAVGAALGLAAPGTAFGLALWVIVAGAGATAALRAHRIRRALVTRGG